MYVTEKIDTFDTCHRTHWYISQELHESNNIAYAVVGEPIQTPLCGKPISDKFGDAFGGVPKTPQAITSAAFNVRTSVNFVMALAAVVFISLV